MRTTESRIPLPTEDLPEQPISTPLDEWLCLEHTGEQVVARYSAELIAVPLMQESSGAWLRLPELPPDQCLTIEQRLVQGQLHCRVHGRCSAADMTMARNAAHHQWEHLELLMEMTAGYRFALCQSLESSMGWQRWLQPRAVQLNATQPIGFGATASEPAPAVWLPTPRTLPPSYGNVLAKLVGLLPENISLSFELRGFTLDESQRRTLNELARGFAVILPTEYGMGRRIDESDACQTLERLLKLWCHAPSGVQLRCRVSACKPLSEGVLNQLSRAVFGESLIHDKAAATLDLSQALPAGVNWPLPLPSADVLSKSGIHTRFLAPLGPLPQSGVRLGYSGQRSVRFTDQDRARHCYILGATGTGKSTLLYNLIRQDLEQGVGLCLLDPHGDLSAQVLDAIPRRRLAEVVRIDPSDAERAVGLNFLACNGPRPGVQMNFVVNEILRIFERLYDMRNAGGPIFELYMRNALLLVMDNNLPGGTLMDIPRLFEDKKFRHTLLTHCCNRHVKSFWDVAERATGDHALHNITGYVISKLNRFTHNPLLQPIIGQAQTSVDWRACLDGGRVVLASLPKGLLGEPDTRLLGMLIVGQLLNAALSRVDQPPAERRPFHLYIDEAHNFTTQTVAELLAEARKFGLHLTLANQHLAQVDDTVEAILGNVGSLMLFRLGVRDSESLAAYMSEALSRRELESLPDYHVAARLLVHGRPTRPFVLRTEPALLPQRSATAQRQRNEILARVYAEHTRPVAEVEAELADR